MTYFSIEIITKGEKSLEKSLESIMGQSYNSFEIVCTNSSSDPFTERILDNYSVKHLNVGPIRHLRARQLAHSLSSGEVSLIMDSTRLLDQNTLAIMERLMHQYDMVAIKEGSIGSGFWGNQARLYKDICEKNIDSKLIAEKIPSYILPRLYKADILTKIFLSLERHIPSKLFDLIGYGEHHIIFQEALSFTESFYHYKEKELIRHYEDVSLHSIYNKYKNYGRDQKILKALPNYKASHLSAHLRELNKNQIMGDINSFPIICVRALSFFVGRFL